MELNGSSSNGALPEALLFDFDGTLMDTERAIFAAWQETFRDYGQVLPLELYVQCIGSDFDAWSPKVYLEELTGESFDWALLDMQRQKKIEENLSCYGPMEGAASVLSSIQAKNICMAVVSSSSHEWVRGWIVKLGLSSFFKDYICRGDAPKIKPAPDLFIEAASRLEVSASKCLVIEDSANGLKAALDAGMRVWICPNSITSQSDFSMAEAVLNSLREIPAKLGLAQERDCDD